MITLRIILIPTLLINFLGANDNMKLGTYGSYGSYSFYTELRILENNKFEYIDRPLNGFQIKINGEWKVKNKKLLLTDSKQFNKKFNIRNDKLCPLKRNTPCLILRNNK